MAVVFALGLVLAIWAGSQAGRIRALSMPVRVLPVIAEAPPPPSIPPPAVEPLVLKDVTPQDAVAINAAVPFSTAPNPAARPFRFTGDLAARARAVDCLAAAMLYEAGNDEIGQRAVGQVVLNRVRHPAFPKTVCGVVFQGQERATGCQFTFTCDGALARVLPEEAWTRARQTAGAALDGRVFAPVGHATHYHTDWVVPYWSASLDKVASVGTHLFFRWAGWWGTPGAFRGAIDGREPVIASLAPYAPAHGGAAATGPVGEAGTLAAAMLVPASKPKSLLAQSDSFLILLDRKASPDSYVGLAIATCGARDYCKVLGWSRKEDMPGGFPVDAAASASLSFSFLRNRATGFEKPLWNCTEFKRASYLQCMKGRGVAPIGTAPLRPVAQMAQPPAPAAE